MAKITLDKIKALIKDIDNQIQNFADTMLDSAQDNLNDVYDSLSKQMNESLHSLDSFFLRISRTYTLWLPS